VVTHTQVIPATRYHFSISVNDSVHKQPKTDQL